MVDQIGCDECFSVDSFFGVQFIFVDCFLQMFEIDFCLLFVVWFVKVMFGKMYVKWYLIVFEVFDGYVGMGFLIFYIMVIGFVFV